MTNTVSENTILPISGITILSDVNIRELDTDYVNDLMEAQLEYGESHWQTHWKEMPKINQDGILFSGFHTITAAKRNFGNKHQVSFQVVEGNPYLLAACENASHGKRRTNTDKRAAVLRWLQDGEGMQWTDSYIAKLCHVSDFLVSSVDASLQENGSESYNRPTKRKYIDKYGNISWMETAKINDAADESAGETKKTIKTLWEQINPAISAWKQEREGVGHASKTMFIQATLRWQGLPIDTKTSVEILKELLNLLTTKETNILETLIRKKLDGKSLWDDEEETEATEQQETAQPSQTAEERETHKLLKQKKGVIKSLWDKRIEAARDYTGDADSELNLHLTLPELEKGFAKCEDHKYCADAFQSAMRRTSETSFNICLEKTLSSDVSLENLKAEYKAIHTYALDILTWERQEWIQQLIDKKRARKSRDQDHRDGVLPQKAEAAETPPKPENDMDALWDAFNKRLPKWKAKYAESGYKENDLIQGATEAELFDALRLYRDSDQTGEVTTEEIKDVTDLMKSQSYPFARRVRDVLRDKRKSEGGDPDAEADTSLDDLNLPALKSFLDSLMYHVGRVENSAKRDDLSVAVWEVFYPDAGDTSEVTARDVLSILIDCAQTAMTEEE